ncbi:MAG: PD-(D/E)XK motif protein [Salinivirgaceae bacterium]|nr:PD-(D/E)XK motif protein [Salinivirgaceae bacterium]
MITEYDFNLASGINSWKRVGDTHPVNLYYGKDDKGRNAIEFKGNFIVNHKIHSSVVIDIVHYKNTDGTKSIEFSLLDNKLLHPFCDFLNSLVDATSQSSLSNQDAYHAICEVYFFMQKMFRTSSGFLTEAEIKGLIGELLFLSEHLFKKMSVSKAISSWSGAEKTRKDFAFDKEWFEVKTIDFGKETVHISSIEQLDSPVAGSLVVFQLERMAEEYKGITLNNLVSSVLNQIPSINDKDILASKLKDYNYAFHPNYDEFVYELRATDEYMIDANFPRISRSNIPSAIAKASFDLILAEILPYKK